MPIPSQHTPLKWYQRKATKWGLGTLTLIAIAFFGLKSYLSSPTQAQSNITDSPSSIIGFNHVGISVLDLDKMLDFYQRTTSFELIIRETVKENPAADKLFGQEGISFERAVLKAPNMLLELTEFENQSDSIIENMPPQGPGMTHTCYQSAMARSGYALFKKGGIDMLTRGEKAVKLGNYAVSYAYGYDPEGNMLEMEQMSEDIISLNIDSDWAEKNPIWMTQVAILSPDIDALKAFYQTVLEIEPAREGLFKDNPAFDEVANLNDLSFKAAWFMLDGRGKKLELMEYQPPNATPKPTGKRRTTDLGYSYSYEVLDIDKEYQRLQAAGVEFVSEPQKLGNFVMVYAHDLDGNVFSLRQALEEELSLKNF